MKKLAIVIFIVLGCSHSVKVVPMDAKGEFERAMSFFNKGDYNNAITLFKSFFDNHPGSKFIDAAQFYLGESYFKIKDYESALEEFQFLVNNFPGSKYLEMGYLRRAECLEKLSPYFQRDQELTKRAIDAYREFIIRYPYSKYKNEAENGEKRCLEKLNLKDYYIALQYYKIGQYKSAIIYLERLIKKESNIKDKAYLLLGDCYKRLGNKEKAREAYSNVSGNLKKEAEKRIGKLR